MKKPQIIALSAVSLTAVGVGAYVLYKTTKTTPQPGAGQIPPIKPNSIDRITAPKISLPTYAPAYLDERIALSALQNEECAMLLALAEQDRNFLRDQYNDLTKSVPAGNWVVYLVNDTKNSFHHVMSCLLGLEKKMQVADAAILATLVHAHGEAPIANVRTRVEVENVIRYLRSQGLFARSELK